MLNHFTFNGHSTGELGLLVSGINIYGSPSRIVEKVTIPYRSGDLIIDTGAYTNYMLTYTVDIMDNTKATAEAISKWLLGSKGYCELTDTYNPEIYRVASYYNQLDYTLSALYRYGKATITFDCKPQKYLTANQPVTLSSTLSEATSYSLSTPAMPLPLTLEGNTTQGANPSPSSPQAIHSVSGDNEIRVVGKNLLCLTPTTVTTNNCTAEILDTNTVKIYGTNSSSGNTYLELIRQYFETGTYCISVDTPATPFGIIVRNIGTGSWLTYIANSSTNGSFTLAEKSLINVEVLFSGSVTMPTKQFNIMIEKGSTATTYEPYKSQVYPINLGSIELNALGTYKDYFHKTNGKWYLHKETGTADIGSLTWSKGSTSYYMNDLASVFKIPLQTETPEIKSSIGMIPKSSNAVSGVVGSNEVYINSSGLLVYYFSMTKYASATEFMNAMKGQTMIYQAKPTETEITNSTLISQLNAISKAKTYDGSTTIVQEGTDAQFKLSMPVPTEITSEYFGEPIITVNDVGTIVWNDSLIKVNSAPVTINSQTLQCYYYSQNKNNDVEINEFPKYEQGENYIGSTMDMSVVPNYWKL